MSKEKTLQELSASFAPDMLEIENRFTQQATALQLIKEAATGSCALSNIAFATIAQLKQVVGGVDESFATMGESLFFNGVSYATSENIAKDISGFAGLLSDGENIGVAIATQQKGYQQYADFMGTNRERLAVNPYIEAVGYKEKLREAIPSNGGATKEASEFKAIFNMEYGGFFQARRDIQGEDVGGKQDYSIQNMQLPLLRTTGVEKGGYNIAFETAMESGNNNATEKIIALLEKIYNKPTVINATAQVNVERITKDFALDLNTLERQIVKIIEESLIVST